MVMMVMRIATMTMWMRNKECTSTSNTANQHLLLSVRRIIADSAHYFQSSSTSDSRLFSDVLNRIWWALI
eukprot:3681885-Amphidinium_carterae.1